MAEFNQVHYQAGYAEAASWIDTYGVEVVRKMTPMPGTLDWTLGWQTCIGVTLERELSG